jgi:PAS domain S-box-containing protein
MRLHNIKTFLSGTLRGRLIVSVAIIHAMMMTLFVIDLTVRQRAMLLENQTEAAIATSYSLATSAAGWIAADDLSGLQELVEAQQRYPEISFVILTDETGLILAHTDKSKVGLYLLDLPQEPQQTMLERSAELVDVAIPAMLNDRHVGWARVGLGQASAANKLTRIVQVGFLYAFAAIFIGTAIAWGMGTRITQRLYAVQETISQVRKGIRTARAIIGGTDEASSIAHEFNSMLDALDESNQALSQSEAKYRQLVLNIQAAIVVHGPDANILMVNPRAKELLGLNEEYTSGTISENPFWRLTRDDGTAMPVEEYPVIRVLATRQPLRDMVAGIHRIAQDDDVWVLINADPLFDYENNIVQVIVTFIDISKRIQAENALRVQEKHSQSLLRLSRKLEQAKTYSDTLNAAYDEVRKTIGYQNLWVYLLSENGKSFKALIAGGDVSNTAMSEAGTATLPIQGDKMLEEIAEARGIVVVEDAQTDPRTNKDIVTALGNRTIVNVPILLFDKHLGSIGTGTFGDEGVRVPTASECEYLVALASHMAITLDRIYLLDQRKKSVQALQENEEKFRTLAENSPDNIARYDTNCQTIYVNPTLEKTLNRTAPEMLGTFPGEAGFIAEAKEYQDKMREVLQTGKEAELDVVLPDTGEGKRYHNIRFVAEQGVDGAITGVQAIGRDITERKQMEEALSKSESELRTLINTMTDIIFVGNSEGRFLKIIDTNASHLYKPPQELLGRTLHEVFPKEKADFFLKHLRQALETKQSVDFEYDLMIGDQLMWFYATISPMTEDQTLMVARNITVQKQAEEALQKNNALLERIFSSTEFLIAYMDTDFNFIRVNRAYAESDNLEPEFFIGKNHFVLYPNKENEAIFKQVLKTGESYVAYAKPFNYLGSPKRGITYWNWTLQPVKEMDGHINGLVLSLVDVTEREKAILAQREIDSRYRTLVEQANDGIFVSDPQGNYVDVNPSGCAMLGYTRAEILKLNMKDLASAESQRQNPLQLEKLRSKGSILTERTLNTKSGKLLPVEISGKILDNGYILGIVRDITDRKRHELEHNAIITVSAALRQVNTRLEILNVVLDQLEELFKADGVVLVLPNPKDGSLTDVMGRGVVGERTKGLVIPPGAGVCNWVIKNKKPYLNNQAKSDPLFYRTDLLGDSHCLAAVPLVTHEQAIGALWIARSANITEQDLHLLNAIADIAANAIHRITLHEQTEQQLRHLLALHEIDLAITTNSDLNATLDVILKYVQTELNVDAASILLVNTSNEKLEYSAGIGFRTDNIKQVSLHIGEGAAGRAALEHRTASTPDLGPARETFIFPSLLADEEFVSHYATPLLIQEQVKGVLEVFHRIPLDPIQDWLDYFETLATQAAIAIENQSLLQNLQQTNSELSLAYEATIEGWSRALDLRDKETEGHTQRVTEMALVLAEKIGMSKTEKANLRRGALLHDIGKMGVPDAILHKPGKLTDQEWQTMRQHPTFAHQMLSPIAHLNRALEIPYCHHEKWDGTGYPHGLKGEAIPLAARVFSIVDVFDALTTNRPYRKAWSYEEAYRYIEEQAGKHFDPQIVKVFLENKKT